MKKGNLLLLIFFIFLFSSGHAQNNKADTSLSLAAIKLVLPGLWAGPDESYYFLFRGDSVKEWEADGSDSTAKPFCTYTVSKVACDTNHSDGSTGFFLTITCNSVDYDETKCYFIQSITAVDLQLGIKGKFDESGHLKKAKKYQ